MTRRIVFVAISVVMIFGLISVANYSNSKKFSSNVEFSLAQWSFHRAFKEEGVDPMDFPKMAKELGFTGVEYVNHIYTDGMSDKKKEKMIPEIALELKKQSELHDIKNVLIMIDGEGDLAHSKKGKRDKAIEKHMRWVNAAVVMGCSSIRVNLTPFKKTSNEEWHQNSVEGLGRLAKLAAEKNINVIVENHGGKSSDGKKLAAVISEINLSNCGTLPDFGNFCIDGSPNPRNECTRFYDRYVGTKELMPFAKGVSAKSYDFDKEGNETSIDYMKMLQIVKDAGYSGFIGVEYEGDRLSEEEGVIATKKLLLNTIEKLN